MKSGEPKISKRPGTEAGWTLLFIGDHGNVVTLKHLKAIVIAAGFLFVLALILVAVLLYLNKMTRSQNNKFQKRVVDSEQHIEKLRHEKEILMARLVLAESKTKKTPAGDQQSRIENKEEERKAKQPPAPPKPETVKARPKQPPSPQVVKPAPPAEKPREIDQPMSVTVENFKILRESDNGNLTAQFKIKNTSPDSQRVAGHAVVVLKGVDLQKDNWLVMPAVSLVGEKPSGRRGKRFSIQRFRTMNYAFKVPSNPDQFQTAAVYVFTETGQLLLEEDFSVKLPPVPAPTADSPSAQKPAGARPLDAAPTAQTPASGESVDPAMEEGPPVY